MAPWEHDRDFRLISPCCWHSLLLALCPVGLPWGEARVARSRGRPLANLTRSQGLSTVAPISCRQPHEGAWKPVLCQLTLADTRLAVRERTWA